MSFIKAFCISNSRKLILKLPGGSIISLNKTSGYKRGNTLLLSRKGEIYSIVAAEHSTIIEQKEPKKREITYTHDEDLFL